MTQHYDVCINGAGPIGSTLACLLVQAGMRVLLLEKQNLDTKALPSLDGRTYALTEGSRPLLEQAGLWKNLPSPPEAIRTITVSDGEGRFPRNAPRTTLLFTPEDAPEHQPFGWMVEANTLLASIGLTLETQPPSLRLCSPMQGKFAFSAETVTITLEQGEIVTTDLVIAADGRRSELRKQAGIGLTTIPYHKSALVAIIAHKNSHHGAALENFLPQGPFARLPLPPTPEHPHRSAVVWTDRPDRIDHFRSLPDASFVENVQARLAGEALGEMQLIGQKWLYPLSSQYAHNYVSQRLILVGDAAHGLHPVAGQGMNLGFRDIQLLAPLLTEAFQNGLDFGEAGLLKRYQWKTRPHNLAMLAGCDLMERLFSNDRPLLQLIRQAGLRLLERSPRLRQSFVKQAMGL
ncbi:FAD-dependent monooxygenase [Acetobacteraceae bacterium ESL0709]|nr:FAD-dependent monooxygenase [Acetobacteraceae bacterium ESL0697]MDF7678739.1 FAD-dependent monooxygenase [Acetobacteraceae bacterium ESL0709]